MCGRQAVFAMFCPCYVNTERSQYLAKSAVLILAIIKGIGNRCAKMQNASGSVLNRTRTRTISVAV